ncbi:MAG: hypothetical protein JST19_06755 [Bacteroidetes bacterium]|nr:hypothetical protein [Bacteroidota bacterium]
MKKAGLSLLLLVVCLNLSAQKLNFDSLLNIALQNRYKPRRMPVTNRDSLFKLLPRARSQAERVRLIYQVIGNGLDLSRAELSYHYKILDWAKAHNDKGSEAIIMSELGYNFLQNGDNNEASIMLFRALKLAEDAGDRQALGIVYLNLSLCFQDNVKLSKSYNLKALQFSKAAHDDLYTINAMQGLGRKYYREGRADSGAYYFFNALSLSTRVNVPEYTCATLAYIASVQSSDPLALRYFRVRAAIALTSGNAGTISHAFDGLALFFLKHHEPDSGLYYARKAYNYAGNLSFASQIRPVTLLAQLFDGRNADSALKYEKLYNRLHDSTNNISKLENAQAVAFDDQQRRQEALNQKQAYQNRQRLYWMLTGILFLLILAAILGRNNRQKQKANQVLANTLEELRSAQAQLVQREKMASLGELTAGIAHEIQNPLNFVNNFSEVSAELVDELGEELAKGDLEEVKAIAADIKENLEKIRHHGKRADGIVKGMLEHSRTGTGRKEPTDLGVLADEYLHLAYHGYRAKDGNFSAGIHTSFAKDLPRVSVVPKEIGRVLLNLFNNAFYAVSEKAKTAGPDYQPEVSVSTSVENNHARIMVKDNGTGIPANIREKIMQPFFTTKPTGEGTGLGLSLSYDIVVKGHGGNIELRSEEGFVTEFTVILPCQ